MLCLWCIIRPILGALFAFSITFITRLAIALLPGLDNFDSSLENQFSDRTESEPTGGRRRYEPKKVLKEKVVRRGDCIHCD